MEISGRLVRGTLYVLLPLSLVLAVVLVQQGVPQTLAPYATVKTIEGVEQVIPLGPAASQIAIKQLGTNGGGFYGVNSAHPFENPTPFTNFLEMFVILMLSAALTYTYGLMAGTGAKAGRSSCDDGAFLHRLRVVVVGGMPAESRTWPHTNMEGKEVRLGVMNSSSGAPPRPRHRTGSVNAMHDSLTPIAGAWRCSTSCSAK
jgi:K+-transporting ATPase ATPase A chain